MTDHNIISLYNEVAKYLSDKDQERVKDAFKYAYEAHDGQLRKSGDPYIIHPISVTTILAKQRLPVTVLIAGLLHDVVEDTQVTYEDIEREFSKEIADIVDGVTKLGNINSLSTEQIKAANHRKIILATAKDVRVILVKLADRVHNMSTIEFMNEAKQKVIASETLEVYTPIAHRLGMYTLKWELEDLSFKVINRDAYDEIVERLDMKRSKREEVVRKVITDVTDIIEDHEVDALIKGRSKHIYSIYKKMKTKNLDFEDLTDLFAFRVIVNTIPECYTVLGIIHENYKPIPMRFKDYIPTPKHNLYQSIHTTVITSDGFPIEFQIRTKEMDLIAEHGVASHWMYKSDEETIDVQQSITYQIEWLKQLAETTEQDHESSLEFMHKIKSDVLTNSLIVYTPQGDVVELPVGSTVLDFAYYIHSNVGNQAVSARVNEKVVSLSYKVHIGDVIEIVTSSVAEPSISWLQKVRTTRAREQIKKYFNNAEKQSIRHEGQKLLVKVGLDMGVDNIKTLIEEDRIDPLLIEFDSQSRDHFLYDLGIGLISLGDVIKFIKDAVSSKIDYRSDIIIDTDANYTSRMCRFCSPIPGDEIKTQVHNHFNNEVEYMVHRTGCGNIREDAIDSMWNYENLKETYPCRLEISILDEKKTVFKVFETIGACELNVTSIYFRASVGNEARGRISLEVNTLKDYEHLYERLMQLDVVSNVDRIMEA